MGLDIFFCLLCGEEREKEALAKPLGKQDNIVEARLCGT
jgi:hypothetical protein